MNRRKIPTRTEPAEKVPESPITQEVPRKSRKTLMAILLVAVVAVASVGVFIWWYTQKDSTPSSGFNTYSRYGVTFEYPKGMAITEQGMLESIATDSSGMIIGELSRDEDEVIAVGWISMVTPPDDLTTSLADALEGMEDEDSAVDPGQLVNSTKAGHIMMYQYFTAAIEGDNVNGIWAVWYCDTNHRFYELGLMYTEQNVLPKFQQYLNSFICH